MLNWLIVVTFGLSFVGLLVSTLKIGSGKRRADRAKWLRPFGISIIIFLGSGVAAYFNYSV